MITSKLLFETFVAGTPKPQPRPRAFARSKVKGEVPRAAAYDVGTAEGWKSAVALAVRELEGLGLISALMVTLTIYMPRPKAHFTPKGILRRARAGTLHTQQPDGDNMAKAILDCLTTVTAWRDDSQITDTIIRKRWATTKPGCRIQIHELTE